MVIVVRETQWRQDIKHIDRRSGPFVTGRWNYCTEVHWTTCHLDSELVCLPSLAMPHGSGYSIACIADSVALG